MAVKVIEVLDISLRVLLMIIFIQSVAALGQLSVPLVESNVSSHSGTCSVAEQHKSNLRRDVTNTLRNWYLIPECGNGHWY